jgi:hypothetical protein
MKKLIILSLLLILTACTQNESDRSNSPEILHQQALSRDYHYLVFNHIAQPYELTIAVGGEQINIQKIWAFKGQQYQIVILPIEGNATLDVSGDGLTIKQQQTTKTERGFTVTVLNEDAMIEVSQTARPMSANYKILITRLK